MKICHSYQHVTKQPDPKSAMGSEEIDEGEWKSFQPGADKVSGSGIVGWSKDIIYATKNVKSDTEIGSMTVLQKFEKDEKRGYFLSKTYSSLPNKG